MNVVFTITLAALSAAGLLVLIRVLRGPSTLDRILGLDIVAILLVSGTVVTDGMHDTNDHLALAAAIALLGFTGTVAATHLIERRRS